MNKFKTYNIHNAQWREEEEGNLKKKNTVCTVIFKNAYIGS